ncbi:MAG TPA: fibronectin type III domain-containing protein [Isosphaeraceae bacterium]|jgi:hypothetical protein
MVSDYYAMLGVDPRADRPSIESALERCRHQWSSGTRNPKYKHTYQSYLDQVPEIRRRLLGDPTARAAYDAELAAEAEAARARKLDELQRLVRLRAAKGGLTVRDRSLLRDRAVALGLTGDDLARLIEPIPPRAEAPAEVEPPEPADDALDPVTRRQIRAALDLVAKRDLYDALGLARDTDIAEVLARADAERQRWMRKSGVTAEKTAWLEVVSYAQSHLGQPPGREKYDRSLARDAEEDFGQAVVFALEGLNSLDPGTRSVLLDEASARGIAPDRAERLLVRACREKGVARDGGPAPLMPGGDAPARYLRCRACGGVVAFDRVKKDPDRSACRHCRAPLRWECPSCRSGHWVDEPRCPCGFELKHLEPLVRHFEAAQHAHRLRDESTALEHLARVQEFAPHHVGARKAIERIKERLAEVEAVKSEFDLARTRRHLLAARQALAAWSRLVAPDAPDLVAAQAELLDGLREAQAHVARARSAADSDPVAARQHYRKALSVASDLPDAREGLRHLPPDPPSALRSEIVGESIVLRWTPPPPDGLGAWSYRIIRKVGGVPAQAADGTVVAEVEATEATDRGTKPGQVVGYAVFTTRAGVASTTAATLAPFPFLLDVRDLRAEGEKGEIRLSWGLPPKAIGAKVVRLGGPGGSDRPLDALADLATDRGLEEGRIYRYRVSAFYRGSDGRSHFAPGVEIAASPTPPAAPAGPLTVARDPDGRVEVRWPPVPRGTVKVLRTSAPPPCPVGSRLGTGEANRLEGAWLESDRIDSATDPDPPTVGACLYTPFVFLNGTATAGSPVGYSSVPDPTDLRAVRVGSGGRVHLRWRWTPRATEAIVVARPGLPPTGPQDPDAVSTTVNEADYSRQGHLALTLPVEALGGGAWHLAVFSVAIVDGQRLVSPGLQPTARTVVPGPNPEITVGYTLNRPTFPGRPWSITFRTEPPGSAVPPMALVAHPRTIPLSSDDGQIIERFPACRDGATFPVRHRLELTRHLARLFTDPAADPAGLPPIRLRHPESAGTRA